jgi:hypothetical protein
MYGTILCAVTCSDKLHVFVATFKRNLPLQSDNYVRLILKCGFVLCPVMYVGRAEVMPKFKLYDISVTDPIALSGERTDKK